jgi:general secretion pathway protein I
MAEKCCYRTKTEDGGFTLLEVMIALAIISISLVTLLCLGNRSIDINGRLQKITQATLLAQHKMTEVETFSQNGEEYQEEEGDFDTPFNGYRWRTTLEDTPLSSIQMVTVIVSWGDEKKNEMVDLTSFLFQ